MGEFESMNYELWVMKMGMGGFRLWASGREFTRRRGGRGEGERGRLGEMKHEIGEHCYLCRRAFGANMGILECLLMNIAAAKG